MTRTTLAATFFVGLALGAAGAWYGPGLVARHQPYAGQDARAVSSLSAKDVAQLEAGEGRGLAKPAELNGYPGPAHVIELADDLALTPEQTAAVQTSFAAMRERARKLGVDLIAAERQLDAAFESGTIDRAVLDRLLKEAETVRAALRGVHLAAHLEVTPLLNEAQRERYAALRGYGDHDGHGGH